MSIVKPIPVNLPFPVDKVPGQESAKHTCGPWRTQGWVPTWAYIPVKDARHNLICSMYPDPGHDYTREEVQANARLIVAAPDLLAVANALVSAEDFDSIEAAKALARDAIAKVTGEA